MNIDKALKIGPRLINNVSDFLIESDIKNKILYVSDPIVDSLFGDIVKKQIKEVGILKEEIIDSNTISFAMAVAERVIATEIDCIVAIGGGKVLDTCKYAAYISKKPLLSIPTTMANDGIASPIAVLKRKDGKPKSLGCAMPSMLLLDTELIMQSPLELVKAGIGDTISNYMALKDWEFACDNGKDKMNGYAFMMSKASLDALIKTQYKTICPEFINVLANSLVLSGIAMDYAGSSRPVSGSEHLFSHALDYYSESKNLHGIQVALGTVTVLKLLDLNYKDVLDYLNKFEVKINPKQLGIDQDTFVFCLKNATTMRNNRYTYLNAINLETDKLIKLYKELTEEL